MVDILHSIEISATPKDIYQAITTEKGLDSWWTVDGAFKTICRRKKSWTILY